MTSDFFATTSGYRIQKTLAGAIHFEGIGLHSGQHATVKLLPAPANSGIRFERSDLSIKKSLLAEADSVVCTDLATTLGDPKNSALRIGTVEHLLAALYALGISNLKIQVHGPEIPILDGSAGKFIQKILEGGIQFQPYTMPVLRVLKPIKVYQSGAICELLPRNRLRITTSVDFSHPKIGLQTYAVELTPGLFRDEIALARTFGFEKDLQSLRSRNLALGASVSNVLAFSDKDVINVEGMRFVDECVRHKTLDAIGDLALSGCWLEAEMVSFRAGHSMHLELLKAMRKSPSCWVMKPAEFIGKSVESPAVFA